MARAMSSSAQLGQIMQAIVYHQQLLNQCQMALISFLPPEVQQQFTSRLWGAQAQGVWGLQEQQPGLGPSSLVAGTRTRTRTRSRKRITQAPAQVTQISRGQRAAAGNKPRRRRRARTTQLQTPLQATG